MKTKLYLIISSIFYYFKEGMGEVTEEVVTMEVMEVIMEAIVAMNMAIMEAMMAEVIKLMDNIMVV